MKWEREIHGFFLPRVFWDAVRVWAWYYAITELFDRERCTTARLAHARWGECPLGQPVTPEEYRDCSAYARSISRFAEEEIRLLGVGLDDSKRARDKALEEHERELQRIDGGRRGRAD